MDEIPWLEQNWQFMVGTGIALLGIATGIAIAWWQRRPEHLDYEVRDVVAFLSRGTSDVQGKLRVIYEDGSILDDPHVITVRVQNTGKRGVASEDYKDPIRVRLENDQIFHAFISRMSKPGLHPVDDVYDESEPDRFVVALTPGLLHAGDWFDVTIINDGKPGGIEVTADWPDRDRPPRPTTLHKPPLTPGQHWSRTLLLVILYFTGLTVVHVLLGSTASQIVFALTLLGALAWAIVVAIVGWRRKRLQYSSTAGYS